MTNSKKMLFSCFATVATAGLAHGITVSNIGTTGVFDANSNANSIDLDPTGQLATFTADVATAYANDLGGVIDWTTGAGALAGSSTSANNFLDTSVSVAYGTGAGQTLTITPDRNLGIYTNNVAGQVAALSDGTSLLANTGNFANDKSYGFSFSGADVVEVGFGMLARDKYGTGVDFRATATFNDASTTSIDFTLGSTIGDGTGSSDTFLHFAAGSGQTISSIFVEFIDTNGQSIADPAIRPSMDDLGFIVVVPEPGSLALLGLGGLLIARRRRG
jgi:hypothetical protein